MLFFFIALLVPCDLRPRERAAERLKDDKGLRDFRFPFLLERFRHDRSDGVEQAPVSAALADRRAHIFTAQATPRRAEDDDPILRAAASVVDPCVCAHSDGVPDGAERLVRPDDRADGVLTFDRQSAVFGAV